MSKYFVGALLFLFVFVSYGQTCTQRLNEAEDDYDAGRLTGIPDKLKNCLSGDGFSREEAIRAQKLLTLVYIYIDEERLAERSVVDLLKLDKEHALDPQTDPVELQFLMDKFQYEPIFRVSVKFGVNKSIVNVIQEFGGNNTLNNEKTYNDPGAGIGLGFTGELMVDKHFFKGIEAAVGIQFRTSNYTVISNGIDTWYPDETPQQVFSNQLIDQQNWIAAPMLVRYNVWYEKSFKIKPYVFIGVQPEYLIKSEYTETSRDGGTPFTLSDNNDNLDDVFDQRRRVNLSAFGGIGTKIAIATNFITVEARYMNAFGYYNKPENKFANQSATFSVMHIEDDISIDYLTFTVGWTHSIYNPKKRKEFR